MALAGTAAASISAAAVKMNAHESEKEAMLYLQDIDDWLDEIIYGYSSKLI